MQAILLLLLLFKLSVPSVSYPPQVYSGRFTYTKMIEDSTCMRKVTEYKMPRASTLKIDFITRKFEYYPGDGKAYRGNIEDVETKCIDDKEVSCFLVGEIIQLDRMMKRQQIIILSPDEKTVTYGRQSGETYELYSFER